MKILLVIILLISGCVLDRHAHLISVFDRNVGKKFDAEAFINLNAEQCSKFERRRNGPRATKLSLWSQYNRLDCGITPRQVNSKTFYEITWLNTCRYVLAVDNTSKLITSWHFSNKTEFCYSNP